MDYRDMLTNRFMVCNFFSDMNALRNANIGPNPVSYTHLDVYKRQAPACESRGFVRKIMKVCILTHLQSSFRCPTVT